MKTTTSKIFIEIDSSDEQQNNQANLKSTRKNLKVLQQVSADKENIIGRPSKVGKIGENEMSEKAHLKKKKYTNKEVQTEEEKITVEDLTSEAGPSAKYWEVLAEKRRLALEETLVENKKLHEQIDVLLEENKLCKEQLEESKHLVAIFTEMLEEKDDTEEVAQATESANEDKATGQN